MNQKVGPLCDFSLPKNKQKKGIDRAYNPQNSDCPPSMNSSIFMKLAFQTLLLHGMET